MLFKKKFLFFLIPLIFVSACNVASGEKSSNTTNTSSIDNKEILDENININSIFKHVDTNYSLDNDHDDISNDLKNEIDSLIDTKYEKNNDYKTVEVGNLYEIGLKFNEEYTIKQNQPLSTDTTNYTIENVKINDEDITYEFNYELNSILFDYNVIDKENPVVDVILKNNEGDIFKETKEIKFNPVDSKYDIKINKVIAMVDKCSVDLTVIHNALDNNNLLFVVSNGEEIIKEYNLGVGNNKLEIDGLLIGHTYEYAIIETSSDNLLNTNYIKGSFSSLLPYKAIISDLTSNSITLNLYDKGSIAHVNSVSVYDGDNKIDEFEKSDKYEVTGLFPQHEYKFKIDYSYEENGKILTSSFYKTFSTYAENEKLLSYKMFEHKLPEISDNVYGITLASGSDVKVYTSYKNSNSNFISKSGSLVKENDVLNFMGEGVELNLLYDSIVSLGLSSGTNNNEYLRTCNLTNGNEYYYCNVYSYEGDLLKQSFYLKSGKYFIYSIESGWFLKDLDINEIVPEELYNEISACGSDIIINSFPALIAGRSLNLNQFDAYKVTYLGNSFVYQLPFINLIIDGETIKLYDGDIVPNYIQTSIYMFYIEDPNEVLNIKIYADGDYKFGMEILNGDYPADLNYIRGENVVFRDYNIVINYSIDDNSYNYKKIKFTNTKLTISYELDGNIYNLGNFNTNDVCLGMFKIEYDDLTFGTLKFDIPFSISNYTYLNTVTFNDEYYLTSKGKPEEFIILQLMDEYGNQRTISYTKIEKMKECVGLLDLNISYFSNEKAVSSEYIMKNPGIYIAKIKYGNSKENLSFESKAGRNISRYDGTSALNKEHDGWEVSVDYEKCKVCGVVGEISDTASPNMIDVLKFNVTSNDYLLSQKFDEANCMDMKIICGTSSTAKDIYAYIDLLDGNGNVVQTELVKLMTNKVTTETSISISSDISFTQIKIRDFNATNAINKKIGIISIEVSLS